MRGFALHVRAPIGRAIRCDSSCEKHSPSNVAGLTLFVRRGQGTHLRALTATDEDGRSELADSDFRPSQQVTAPQPVCFAKKPFRSGPNPAGVVRKPLSPVGARRLGCRTAGPCLVFSVAKRPVRS